MPTITLKVSDTLREAWVADAFSEGCSLSEWLRRAAQVRLDGPSEPVVAAEDGALMEPVAETTSSASGGQARAVGTGSMSAHRSLRAHRADPKDKAAQEHGAREKAPKTGLCAHRVPRGMFCKRCEDA